MQLEIKIRRKPNVYIRPNVNISLGSQNLLMIGPKTKYYILVQNLITTFNCQNELPLDDKYKNHHT